MSKDLLRVGIAQMSSHVDPRYNVATLQSMLQKASAQNASAVFLPEGFYSLSDGKRCTPFAMEERQEWQSIAQLAKTYNIALLGGSSATLDGRKVYMRSLNFSRDGEMLGRYDKRNLFCFQGETRLVDESQIYTPGKTLCQFGLGPFEIGITICFDLRFPELFRQYRKQGVNLFSVSSAFAVETGKVHWHTLLKARAIENQSFVIAAAQTGTHTGGVKTYGHSLVVSPWGEVLLDMEDKEDIAFVDLDFNTIAKSRARLDSSPARI